jgi:hypothetical protein
LSLQAQALEETSSVRTRGAAQERTNTGNSVDSLILGLKMWDFISGARRFGLFVPIRQSPTVTG